MKTKMTLLATTALAALALAAPAEAAGSGWYLSLSGGANWLDDNDFFASNGVDTLTVNTESDAGWVVSGAVGYSLAKMTPGLRVEVEVGYRENAVDGNWTTTTGLTGSVGVIDYDQSALSVMANVWYDFDLGGFNPYIGGGIGWADVEAEGTYVSTGVLGTVPFSYSDDGFAWQAGAGINFRISPNMQLGIGYRYFSGPEVTLLSPNPVFNTTSGDLDYDNHSANVTLTFEM